MHAPAPGEVALELHALGLEIQRQKIRSAAPDLTAEEMEEALTAWLRDRPFDAPGVVRRPIPG